ncbi:MAG TPA: VWA domain-containing protein [Gammaproteobacteria bacterium]|nr:VWA domain-containing protein [Gammaproteobacteria bacterium]
MKSKLFAGWVTVYFLVISSTASAGFITDLTEKFTGKERKIVVVLVDVSGSIKEEDWKIYQDTVNVLLSPAKSIKNGDRIILARIADQTVGNFLSVADETIEETGIPSKDRKAIEVVAERIRGKMVFLQDRQKDKPAKWTNIMESLASAKQEIQRDKERSVVWIVMLSDMVEESKRYNFRKTHLNDEFLKGVLSTQKKEGWLPDLTGVRVYVAGAGGEDVNARKFAEIERFWRGYFKGTGASCAKGDFGRPAIRSFK